MVETPIQRGLRSVLFYQQMCFIMLFMATTKFFSCFTTWNWSKNILVSSQMVFECLGKIFRDYPYVTEKTRFNHQITSNRSVPSRNFMGWHLISLFVLFFSCKILSAYIVLRWRQQVCQDSQAWTRGHWLCMRAYLSHEVQQIHRNCCSFVRCLMLCGSNRRMPCPTNPKAGRIEQS